MEPIVDAAPPREREKPHAVAGEITINGKHFLFGTNREQPSVKNRFAILDPDTKQVIAPLGQVNLISAALHKNKPGEIETLPLHAEPPQGMNPKDLTQRLLVRAGISEPPIKGTVITFPDTELAKRLDATWPDIQGMPRPDWGWKLSIDHTTPKEVLAALGITDDNLYDSTKKDATTSLQGAVKVTDWNLAAPDAVAIQE